jgi:hypothetical protein
MRRMCLFAIMMVSAVAMAGNNDQSDSMDICNEGEIQLPADSSEILFTDDKGNRWTDLHIIIRKSRCMPQYPTIDVQTLKNAKLTCAGKGARLPKLSEVNDLASWISLKYLRGLETGKPEVIDAKFMSEKRYFWTPTVEQESDRFVFNRALARVSTLVGSVDMSKADFMYRPALEDNKDRPFLCVYPAGETSDLVVAYDEYGL